MPADEAARLRDVEALDLLDTPPERAFDDLARLAAEVCDTPIAMVSLIDGRRQWCKAAVGFDAAEVPREASFCAHTIASTASDLVVPDARADRRFAENPYVALDPWLRFYAGVPLRSRGGHAVGTLCVFDVVPRELRPKQLDALRALARQAESQFELRLRLREVAAQEASLREQHAALVQSLRQRDRLTGFLLHDLKNQLTVVSNSASYLRRAPDAAAAERAEVAGTIAAAAAKLRSMTLDVLDLQTAGAGAMLIAPTRFDLAALLAEVARAAAPADQAAVTLRLAPGPLWVVADRGLVGRVVANLLDNAIKYGAAPVEVEAAEASGRVEVRVRDAGAGVPAADRALIFEPFARRDRRDGDPHGGTSRGLGLAFCRAAVEAHGGHIRVEDASPHGCVFCFDLPTKGPAELAS
jgi:signal transduction histidine kinase